MGYELPAVVAGAHMLTEVAYDEPKMRVVPCRRGSLAMSDGLHDLLSVGDGDRLGFWKLPGGFGVTLAVWSHAGPAAYVEAEYFGGVGEQRAAVWDHGVLVLGALACGGADPFPADGSPISRALCRLGATSAGHVDEFVAVGLPRHRRTEQWLGDRPAPSQFERD